MFRVVSLGRRRSAGMLLGLATLTLTLVGFAGGASDSPPKFSAHLTATTFTSAQAGSVELVYRFSKPSKSFVYRLTFRKGSRWQTVTSVKRTGDLKGSKTTTVERLFGGKPIRIGDYRLKLSVDTRSELLGFTVVKARVVASRLSAGNDHTCAVLAAGAVKCWGSNDAGQLGDGVTDHGDTGYGGDASSTPVAVSGISNAVGVSAGGSHTCALLSGGAVKCWGSNDAGQLGNGSTTGSAIPVHVNGIAHAIQVSAGNNHTCAVLVAGAVKCWGDNSFGQLGDGPTRAWTTAVQVPGISNVIQVSAGNNHTCAVLAGGGIKCWGFNEDGQLGDGIMNHRKTRRYGSDVSSTPVTVRGISNAIQVSADVGYRSSNWAAYGAFTCAVLSDGKVDCWGFNLNGELGRGGVQFVRTANPGRVSGITNATRVSVGGSYGCALLSGGGATCWGANISGSLGDGVTDHGRNLEMVDSSPNPVKVRDITGANQIDAGSFHACALLPGGTVKCWGDNSSRQLGNGEAAYSLTPVSVIGVP